MKIEHHVPMVVSCKKMHHHRNDTVFLVFDDVAPLEVRLEMRDRVNRENVTVPDVVWVLPRAEFTDMLTYNVPGVTVSVGSATLRIRTSDPRVVVAQVPFWDDVNGKNRPQYLMFKMSKLRLFFAEAERIVPQSCEDQALDIDRLIGRLLYS